MKQLLIFDFDGTIADGLSTVVSIFKNIAPDYVDTSVSIDLLREHGASEVIKILNIKRKDIPKLLIKGKKEMLKSIPDLRVFPGLKEQLTALQRRGATLVILSTNSNKAIAEFLKNNNMSHIFIEVVGDVLPFGKASAIKKTTRKLGFSAEQVVYTGDEVRDMKAAQSAGVKSAAVCWGFNTKSALQNVKPNYIIENPRELVEYLG